MQQKILITGGNGFLGTNAAIVLSGYGYAIRVMMRPGATHCIPETLACEICYGDICNAEDVGAAVAGCDYVVHTASVTQQWGISYDTYKAVNFTATQHIVKACLQHKVKRLIHVSTANTIGPGAKNRPADELQAFAPSAMHSGYVHSKYLAQQYVLEQVVQSGLPALIINPTFMIGGHDSKPSSGQLLLHGLNKPVVFYPPGGKNFVHVRDVCAGIAAAIHQGNIGSCYLLAGANLPYREFFRLLRHCSGQKPLLLKVPAFVLKLAGAFGSLSGLAAKNAPRLNYGAALMLCSYNYYSGDRATQELGISYTTTADAVTDALEWFRENNYF